MNRLIPRPKTVLALAAALTLAAGASHAGAQDDTAPLNVDLAGDYPDRAPGVKPDVKTLEGGLWAQSLKAEQQAKTSGERNLDPTLDTWVSGVLNRLAGPYSGDVRVYVMDRPFFNAQMAPNGYTEVWSGALLRCQTEDQLAFVIGHEFGHFRHSHVLKNYQDMKDGQNAALAASLLIAVVGAGAEMNAGSYAAMRDINAVTNGLIDITYLGTIAALMNYSRQTEARADAYGMIYARQAGYFTGDNAALWQEMMDETKASEFDKVRRAPTRINIFRDHPLDTDRLTALAKQDAGFNKGVASTRSAADAKAARAAYRAHIRPFLGAWLKDDLRRQDYGQTLFVIDRLSIDGEDMGVLNFYRGEAYRLRDKAGGAFSSDRDNAIAAYKAALESPDAPKDTWRELGEVYRRGNDTKDAIDAYRAYLAQTPAPADAWMVQDQLDSLTRAANTAPAPAAATPTTAAAPASTSPGGTI